MKKELSHHAICQRLRLLEFNFSSSNQENREMYAHHISKCPDCQLIMDERKLTVKRNSSFMVVLGVILISVFGILLLTANRVYFVVLAFGVILIISGLVQWVRGKEHHQK
jgi:hypothetical protein